MTRNGKIARLPREIREQLNRRLANGEQGIKLVAWLNELPEVRRVLAGDFNGREINEQNLSEWKQGGFREWETRQETIWQAGELAADAKELSEADEGSLADHLAMTLVARYAGLLVGWDGEASDEFRRKLRALRSLSQDVVELRRGDHSAARLKLEQEQLKEKQEWSEEELVSHFLRWRRTARCANRFAGNVSVRKKRRGGCGRFLDCRRRKRMRTPRLNQSESNQIKPVDETFRKKFAKPCAWNFKVQPAECGRLNFPAGAISITLCFENSTIADSL